MVKLKRAKIINWYLYQIYKNEDIIDFGDFTMVLAKNGAGKTALIDAIRYAALGESNFNLAADAKGQKRDLLSYVRGQIDRDKGLYYRPVKDMPNVTSHIALEWEDDNDGSVFSTGVIIDMDSSNIPSARWYIMEGTKLEDVPCTYEEEGKTLLADQDRFQKMAHVELWNHNIGVHNILSRLGLRISMEGGYSDYLRKCRSIIKYDTGADIPRFIKENILPRDDVSLEDLKEKIASVRDAAQELSGLQEENNELDKIIKAFNDLQNAQKHVLDNEICVAYDSFMEKSKRREEEIKSADAEKVEQTQQEKENDRMTQELDGLRKRQESLRISIHENEAAKALDDEKARLRTLENTESELKEKENDILVFQHKLEQICNELPDAADEQTKTVLASLNEESVSVSVKQTAVDAVKTHLSSARDDLLVDSRNAQGRLDEIGKQKQKDNAIVEDLRKYQNAYDQIPDYVALRDEINAELKKRGRQERAYLACEYVSGFTDASWQDAIEGFLGPRRYTVLVDPTVYDIADAVFARTRHKDAHLFNTRRLMEKNIQPEDGAVVEFLDIQHPVTRQYFNYVLGRMLAVEDSELKNYDYAIAKTGRVANGMDNYYACPKGIARYYFGKEAREKNLKAAHERLDALDKEESEVRETLREIGGKRHLYDEYLREFKEYDLDICRQLRLAREEINKSKELAAELEKSVAENEEYIRLREQADAVEQDINNLDQQIQEGRERVGSLKNSIKKHNDSAEAILKSMEDDRDKVAQYEQDYPEDTAYVMHEYDAGRLRPLKERQGRRWTSEVSNLKEETLPKLQNAYNRFDPNAPFGSDEREWYDGRKQVIRTHDLPRADEKLRKETEQEEYIFKTEFVYEIQDKCADIKKRMSDINKELKKHQFDNKKYSFCWTDKKGSDFGKILDYAEEQSEVGELVNATEEGRALASEMDQILNDITSGNMKDFDQYADYRNYMDYDVLISDEKGENISLSKRNGISSGAEVQIPYLLMLFSSLLLTYGNADEPDSMRLVIMDEPFTKMDSGKIRTMMEFMQQQNFQAIFCMPRAEEAVLDNCDQLLTILKDNNNGYLYVEGMDDESTSVLQGQIGRKDS